MIWWNRQDFVKYAEPQQVAKILTETQRLTQQLYRRREDDFDSRDAV